MLLLYKSPGTGARNLRRTCDSPISFFSCDRSPALDRCRSGAAFSAPVLASRNRRTFVEFDAHRNVAIVARSAPVSFILICSAKGCCRYCTAASGSVSNVRLTFVEAPIKSFASFFLPSTAKISSYRRRKATAQSKPCKRESAALSPAASETVTKTLSTVCLDTSQRLDAAQIFYSPSTLAAYNRHSTGC